MTVPMTSDLDGYRAFWASWLRLALLTAILWGVVIEGTLLSIRRAVEPVPCGYVAVPSFASVQVRAEAREPGSRSLGGGASLLPIRSRSGVATARSRWSVPGR